MIRKNKNRNYAKNEPIDYWLSSTDILAGLLLIILLVVMLLMLYLVQIPDEDLVDTADGNRYDTHSDYAGGGHDYEYESETERETETEADEEHKYDYSSGGGGGGDDRETETEELFPVEGTDEFTGKCAVYVVVTDEETDTAIKEKGLRFELYTGRGGLKTLYTYYPVKKSYRMFETTESGTFYFPEKLELGSYELHELTVPKGYDIPDHVAFALDESLDWNEAYTVTVRLSPAKNIIEVSVKDSATQKPLPGASFDVLAAEDIITGDGSVRYQKNQIVDRISTDEKGRGESKKLYLGNYLIRQVEVPEYYAAMTDSISIPVQQKSETVKNHVETIDLQKTSATIRLVDELYADQPIEGGEFRVVRGNAAEGTVTVSTDENGEIFLTDLHKNTSYRLHQIAAKNGYEPAQDLVFHVDDKGLIEEETAASFTVTNRTLRINVRISDRIFRNSLSNVNITLFDEEDQVKETWSSTGVAKTISGLSPGNYYLLVGGKEDSRVDVTVENRADLQAIDLYVLSNTSLALLAGGAAGAGVLILLIVKLIRKKKKGNRKEGNE